MSENMNGVSVGNAADKTYANFPYVLNAGLALVCKIDDP